MALSLAAGVISLNDFQEVLSRYDALIQSVSKPSNKDGKGLQELDTYRLVTVPTRLEKVRQESGELYLEKEEVESLIRWKLKHGKFRPSLLQLVLSNSDSQIKAATVSAFTLLLQDTSVQTGVLPALNKLTVLKGIGPASASLLLSVAFPKNVPFFSDEAFRWVMTGVDFSNNAGGKGWDRNIKYDKKEYGEFIRRVREVIQRLGGDIGAVDVEKVGWVLGKEKAMIQGDGVHAQEASGASRPVAKKEAKTVKRKIGDTTSVGDQCQTRRSKRSRK
ncbi:hypothetical protein PILCRDRAFT_826062 [Piloderma croceum F 1598]|uniref:Uncharacterized protein n=1 Tax=Piloderma croceum (strain F 1598) TaxID=765440 RepID=A0A0C3FAB0_PILCF|nr:hypothetical protein PILCRDRAFT_826062 [Piloderma croceum F 1598]